MSYLEKLKTLEGSTRKALRKPEDGPACPVIDLFDGEIIAVRIYSSVLNDQCWLVLREGFTPSDGLVIYHADEFPLLIHKAAAQLREIHEIKKAFPGGCLK